MEKKELNFGSTFKDFLNALNTNTEDTEGIIQGTKKVKKLSLGEEDELGDIEIITKDNRKVVLIYGESICLDVSHDDETSSLQIGDRYSEIYSENGRIHLEAGDGISLHSNKNDTARIELDATNDSENGKLILKADEISIEGNVDFSNANVIGLPNSGGTSDCDPNAIIDVTALPTENINENVIYRLNIATYLFGASAGYQPFPMAKCNVVETLPTSGNPAATFDTSLNVTAIETYYEQSTNRNMGYVDEKLSGIGNMPVGWYTAEQLFAVINRTYLGVIFSTSEMVDMGIYLLIEYALYTYKNGIFKSLDIDVNKNYQWNGDNAFNGNNTFNGSVRLYGYTNFIGDPSEPSGSLAIYTNGFGVHSTETTFTKKVLFNGEVDFSNATITGLSSGGGESNIPEEVISYDSEINLLSLTSNSLALISKNLEFAANTLEDSSISFIVGLNDETGMYASSGILNFFANEGEINFISRDSINFTTGEDSNITFNANIVDFASAEVKVDSLTIGSRESYFQAYETNLTIFDNKNLYLWVEDENGDSSEINILGDHIGYQSGTHTFYGTVDFSNATVTGLPISGGGSLDLNADYNWNGNHTFNNGITLNGALTLANNGEIDDSEDSLIIYKGTGSMWIGTENGGSIDINDDEMRVESYNHLTLSGNGITFGAIDGVSIYVGENDDTGNCASIELNDGKVNISADVSTKFNGNVDFSNANVTGLPSSSNGGGLDISPAIIEYDTEQNYLNIKSPNGSINIYAEDSIYFSAEYGDIVFENPLALQNGAWFGTEGGATFDGSAKFNNEVDFTNATVIGLPSNGLTQEQVQEMINASITEALNDEY